MNRLVLIIAHGFGSGKIPIAPGTSGSLVGFVWFLLLLLPGNLWIYLGGTALGLALSVPVCGAAENILKQKDPGSIVWDEIAAVPLCFASWIGIAWFGHGIFPVPMDFFAAKAWILTILVMVAFRFFDIAKPWPVRQSQKLPGGWGVTIDDALAALYVNLIPPAFFYFTGWSPA